MHERWSILGIHQRYEAMLKAHGRARFTVMEAHDAAYVGMLQTLDALETARTRRPQRDLWARQCRALRQHMPIHGMVSQRTDGLSTSWS